MSLSNVTELPLTSAYSSIEWTYKVVGLPFTVTSMDGKLAWTVKRETIDIAMNDGIKSIFDFPMISAYLVKSRKFKRWRKLDSNSNI